MVTGFSVGAVGGIRTLVPLLTTTRFPVVLVMTSSIPLHIFSSATNSTDYYNKKSGLVKMEFPENGAFFTQSGGGGSRPPAAAARAIPQCSMDVTVTSAESRALPIRCMALPTAVFLAFG